MAIVAGVFIGAPLQGADIQLIPGVSQAVCLGWGGSPLWGFGLARPVRAKAWAVSYFRIRTTVDRGPTL